MGHRKYELPIRSGSALIQARDRTIFEKYLGALIVPQISFTVLAEISEVGEVVHDGSGVLLLHGKMGIKSELAVFAYLEQMSLFVEMIHVICEFAYFPIYLLLSFCINGK